MLSFVKYKNTYTHKLHFLFFVFNEFFVIPPRHFFSLLFFNKTHAYFYESLLLCTTLQECCTKQGNMSAKDPKALNWEKKILCSLWMPSRNAVQYQFLCKCHRKNATTNGNILCMRVCVCLLSQHYFGIFCVHEKGRYIVKYKIKLDRPHLTITSHIICMTCDNFVIYLFRLHKHWRDARDAERHLDSSRAPSISRLSVINILTTYMYVCAKMILIDYLTDIARIVFECDSDKYGAFKMMTFIKFKSRFIFFAISFDENVSIKNIIWWK